MTYLVVVDYCFADHFGGGARVAWDIAALMRDRGHEVAMLCGHPPPVTNQPTSQQTLDGIRVVRYSTPVLPRWHPRRGAARVAAAAAAAREKLSDRGWDLVHAHMTFQGQGARQALGESPRYAYTVHSPMTLENRINWATEGLVGRLKLVAGIGALRRAERKMLRCCAAIHALSEFTRNQLSLEHGLADDVTVIPHWRRLELVRELSKAEARRRLGWPADAKTLFTVRVHGPRYGLDVAIRAVAPLTQDPGCVFYIGGDGPVRAQLEDLAQQLGVADRVRFLGRLADSDLKLAYQAADLFVLPTRALECFGLITVEALSFGLPVIGTDAGATPEVLDPLAPGLIVPAGDVDALRSRVERFLRGRLALPTEQQMVEYVERRFSRQAIAPRMIAFLEQAAAAPSIHH